MLIRRAAATAGLTLGLVAAGLSPAVAAEEDPLGGTGSGVINTLNDTGSRADPTGQVEDLTQQGQGRVEDLTQQGQGIVPGQGGEDALIGEEGLCVDVASESDPPPCESDLLGSQVLNACVGEDEGAVSDLAGGAGGLAETVGLECTEGGAVVPPDEHGPGGKIMPPPVEGAEDAVPAEAVTAAPTFTG